MKNITLLIVLIILFNKKSIASPCSEALMANQFEQALKYAEKDNSHDGHVCAARALLARGNGKEALRHLEISEKLAQTPYEKMLTATYQGRSAKALGDIAGATRYFQQAATLAAESKQNQAQWFNLNELGQIQLSTQDARTSLDTFLQAYKFASNDNERSESDQLIASAYKAQSDLNHAIEFQLKSTLLEKRSGELTGYVDALLELADLRISNRELPSAEKNVREALSITVEAKSDYWNARAFYELARLQLIKGDADAYQQAYAQAKDYAEKAGDKELLNKLSNLKK